MGEHGRRNINIWLPTCGPEGAIIPKLLAASRLSRPEICSSAAPTMALEHVQAMMPGPGLSCHSGFIQLEGADPTQVDSSTLCK